VKVNINIITDNIASTNNRAGSLHVKLKTGIMMLTF